MNSDYKPINPAPTAEISEAHQVLIVEDCAAERIRLTAILRKQGYHAIEAKDGLDAIEKIAKHNISLVVTDWCMPKVSGLQLCKLIREKQKSPPYLLLLTSRTNTCDLVSAMDAGADDYLTKPFNAEELNARVKAGIRIMNAQKSLTQQNEKIAKNLKTKRQEMSYLKKDIDAASRLQLSSLPEKNAIVNNILVSHYFKPAAGLAGDTYSVFPLGTNHVAFYQVDVVGHGVKSAMLSYAISWYLNENAKRPPTKNNGIQMHIPSSVLAYLNREFSSDENSDDYFTIAYGVMNTQTGKGQIALAGHPYPKIVSKSRIRKVGKNGYPIGMIDDVTFEQTEFELNPSEKLVLTSDGILECKVIGNSINAENIFDHLLWKICEEGGENIQTTLDEVIDRSLDTHPSNDDISILILSRSQDEKN